MMTEGRAWREIAERLDRLAPKSINFHLCNRVDELHEEGAITSHTHRDMRTRIDFHMDGAFGSSWDATIQGTTEWEEPNAYDICRERRVLACLLLALEAKDES